MLTNILPKCLWSALLMGLVALACAPHSAEASHGGVYIGIDSGPRYAAEHYASGYWTYRTESVLVEPARYQRVWVEPQYTRVTYSDGSVALIKVRDGYYRDEYLPARYEARTVRVWVPTTVVHTHGYSSAPHLSFGLGVRFK